MTTRSPRLDSGASSPFFGHPMRSSSFSSDVNSTRSTGAAPTVPHANPPPAYVASNEANDLISTELARTVHVTPAALTLLNEFLDHVLYCILCTSHSLSLGQLKSAVPVVLKPRLGKSALKCAEEELKDYIEDDEAEDLYSNKNNIQAKLAFDPDFVWKLARLRCMVYARMGDLEEEDEEEWLEKEGLLDQNAALSDTTRSSMAVNPGAAIFLTSIIEYLGEQALYYAAQYAQRRHDSTRPSDNTSNGSQPQLTTKNSDILLDGKDMNHVGRDSPLSRLWRSWRRNTRSSADSASRPMSPDDTLPPALPVIRSESPDNVHLYQPTSPTQDQRRASNHSVHAVSRIPPPILENDPHEDQDRSLAINGEHSEKENKRPQSMPTLAKILPGDPSSPSEETPQTPQRSPLRPKAARERSNSLPATQTSLMTNKESNSEDSRGGSTPTQETVISSSKRNSKFLPEHISTAVPILAGALPVVGVHHIQQHQVSQPLDIDTSNSLLESQSKSLDEPLTSASITGPLDFDTMYVPDGRTSPEAGRSEVIPAMKASTKTPNPYQELAARQLEEHQRYSQQSHEMNTPSIYSNQEHAPRFRRDSSPVPRTAERTSKRRKEKRKLSSSAPEAGLEKATPITATTQEPEQVTNRFIPTPEPRRAMSPHAISPEPGRANTPYAPSSYAPTPEPGIIYDDQGNYVYGATADEPTQSWQRQTDSPVSQMSGKYPAKRYHPTNEPVPEMPKTIPDQQTPADGASAAHPSGHSKSSSSSSRLLGFTRDTSGKPHSIYQQSAIGAMTDEVRRQHSSTPDDKHDLQEIETQTSSPKRNHLRIRGDSETNVLKTPSNTYHTQRSLEHLIQSDETLRYTLTPATASLSEENINSSSKRTGTQDLADFFRNTAPPGQENTSLPSARSRKASMNATRAPQVLPIVRGSIPSSNGMVTDSSLKPKHKNPLGEPRDAKVDRASGVRDLADYARSTGPSNPDQLPKRVVSGPLIVHGGIRPVEMAAPNSPTDKSPKPRPQNRLKFQARDPRPSRHAEPTDLVDFIREGPPRSQEARSQAHSIRTTTASDDTNNTANNRHSSTTKHSAETNGMSSVTDSQSPLITNDNNKSITTTPTTPSFAQQISQAESFSNGSAEGPTIATSKPRNPNKPNKPKPKQKPVKDPYPIDYTDTDDLKPVTSRPKRKTEESLIDFLRNTEPPSSAAIAQPIISSSAAAALRSNTNTPAGPKNNNTFPRTSKLPDSLTTTQSQARARAESPHLTQAGSKLDVYRPTQATHASHVDRNRNNKSRTRTGNGNGNGGAATQNGNGAIQTLKAFGGGGAGVNGNGNGNGGGTGGETADLAAYLKSTRPTSVQAGWTEPLVARNVNGNGVGGPNGNGNGGLRKFFSIKRK